MKQSIVILGGGYAGLIASNRLAKLNKNLEITLVNNGENFVERIRNHERASGIKRREFPITKLLNERIHFLNGKIERIFPETNEIKIETIDLKMKYDILLYAMGSTYLPSDEMKSYVITKQSAESIYEIMQNQPAGNLCVVGGGLTGIELATDLKEANPSWKIQLVTKGKFASSFSVKGREYLEEVFNQMEIGIKEEAVVDNHISERILFTDGSSAECQVLIDSTGFSCSKVATHSGFPTNKKNQIFVNQFLQSTKFPNVFVAGDACYMEYSYLRMGCVTALPLGVQAAENINRMIRKQKLEEFSFNFLGRCVSLGRKKGLIQITNTNDSPLEMIITGRIGSWIKEMICRYTLLSIRLEKWLPFRTYQWPKRESKLNKLEKSYE